MVSTYCACLLIQLTSSNHSMLVCSNLSRLISPRPAVDILLLNPGRVITADKLAFLIAEAWPHSFTAVNTMSGFRKCGVFPFNPSTITDRQIAPSKAFRRQSPEIHQKSDSTSECSSPLFSPEKEALYQKRYDEGYDLKDPEYVAWLKMNHPDAEVSTCSMATMEKSSSSLVFAGSCSSGKSQASQSSLSEILVLPCPAKPIKQSKHKPA